MIKGDEYNLEIALCKSENYESISRVNRLEAHYTTPIILRIWSRKDHCDLAELLAASVEITHTDWQSHYFSITPNDNYNYIVLEAFYVTPVLFPYNGNILLDDAEPYLVFSNNE